MKTRHYRRILLASRRCVVAVVAICAVMVVWVSGAWAASSAPSYDGASADGLVVVFSTTEQLVPGDTDQRLDVYQRSYDADPDIGSIVTREMSTGPTGGNDAYPAFYDGASGNGGRVFFSTQESLVAADRDRAEDVYMREPGTGRTVLMSQGAKACSPGCGNGMAEAVFAGATPDGGYIFFETNESLTTEDEDESFDVYERNLTTGETMLVSKGASSCAPGCGNGAVPAQFAGVSEDGIKAYYATAESLVGGDGNAQLDIYQRNLVSGETILVSGGGDCPVAEESDCGAVWDGSSPDGSDVYFHTAEQISGEDQDQSSDVYAWSGGTATLVSAGPIGDGTATATFAGASVTGEEVFFQTAEAMVLEDGDSASDVYERDRTTGETDLVSRGAATCSPCGNGGANAISVGVSTDGDKVFFQSSEAMAPGGRTGPEDVYVRNVDDGYTALVSAAAVPCGVLTGCGSASAGAALAGITSDGAQAFITTKESLGSGDVDGSGDLYVRDLLGDTTIRVTGEGVCPLSGERGCDAGFGGVSDSGDHVFFTTAKRLSAEDVDSEVDVYEAAWETGAWKMRLVSVGNSLTLGPATPVLIGTNPISPASTTSPSLLGRADSRTAIKVYATVDCSGAPVATGEADGSGEFEIPVTVEAGTTREFRAAATDVLGDTSGCSGPVAYRQATVGSGDGGTEGSGSPGGQGGTPASPQGPVATPSGNESPSTGRSNTPESPRPGATARPIPQVRITFSPAGRTKRPRPIFRFRDETEQAGVTFLCKVDHHRWLGCRSPHRLRKLAVGHHVFQVVAVGPTGERQVKPVRRAFKVVKP